LRGGLPRTFPTARSEEEAGVPSFDGMLILESLIGVFAIAAIAATATTVAKDGYRRIPTRRY
jgi:hypothetical protein